MLSWGLYRRAATEKDDLVATARDSQRSAEDRLEVETMSDVLWQTWPEKVAEEARARGIAEGIAEGQLLKSREILRRLLEKRFGPLPQARARQIESVPIGRHFRRGLTGLWKSARSTSSGFAGRIPVRHRRTQPLSEMRSHIRSGLANSPGNLLDQGLEFRGATNRLHVRIFLKQVQEFLGGELAISVAIARSDEWPRPRRTGQGLLCERNRAWNRNEHQPQPDCKRRPGCRTFRHQDRARARETSLGDRLLVATGPDQYEGAKQQVAGPFLGIAQRKGCLNLHQGVVVAP